MIKKVIHKYRVVNGVNKIPKGSKILKLDYQSNEMTDGLFMWILVPLAKAPIESIVMHIMLTGGQLPEPKGKELEHVGSCMYAGDSIVVHVFKEVNL